MVILLLWMKLIGQRTTRRRPHRRLAVVARGGPALNLDDWSYDALPWSAWSNDQADVESFYVTDARELYVEGELDAAGIVGLERTLLAAAACAVCYAMYNKRQQRQKLVPCDAYCTCPAHANHSSHFATRLESA